jgi:hypothetical protein
VLVQDQRQPKEKVTIVAESARILIPPGSSLITFKIANGVITRTAEDLKANARAYGQSVRTLRMGVEQYLRGASIEPGTTLIVDPPGPGCRGRRSPSCSPAKPIGLCTSRVTWPRWRATRAGW